MARIWASLIAFFCLANTAIAETQPPSSYKTVSIDGPEDSRNIAVRVNERISERALYDLANEINTKRKTGETVASVSFFLPKADLAAQPWAIARFQGALPDVSILGLRAEEEALFRSEAQLDSRDVVGVWLTSPPALPGKLTILRSKEGLVAEWHLRSGQKTTDRVTTSRTSRGMRYTVVGGDGAYYLATYGGDLLLGDASRVIAVAEKLPVDPTARVAAKTTEASPVSATADPASPVAKPSRTPSRRASRSAPARKSSATVADMMGGAIAR